MPRQVLHCTLCGRRYAARKPPPGAELCCASCGGPLAEGRGAGPARPAAKDPFRGRVIAGARLSKLLAVRPLRRTYLARHEAFRTDVRVDLFPSPDADAREADLREMFAAAVASREARSLYVSGVLDLGRVRDGWFIIAEHHPATLRACLERPSTLLRALSPSKRGPLKITEALRVTEELLQGLQALHGAGVVHGAISAEAVLIAYDGRAVLDHPGCRPLPEARARLVLTAGGSVTGPAVYEPPEAGSGRPSDVRSDIYSLAVLLHEMLAGAPPYLGRTAAEVRALHASATPPDLGALRPGVPPEIAQLVAQWLSKEPSARPASAADALGQLRALAVDLSRRRAIAPVPGAATERQRTFGTLRWAAAWGAVLLALIALSIAPVSLMCRERRERMRTIAEQATDAPQRVLILIGASDPTLLNDLPADAADAVRGLLAQRIAFHAPLVAADPRRAERLQEQGGATEDNLAQAGARHALVAVHAPGLGRRKWTLTFVTPGRVPFRMGAECAVEACPPGRGDDLAPLQQAADRLLDAVAAPAAPVAAPASCDARAWALFARALDAERDARWADASALATEAMDAAPSVPDFAFLRALADACARAEAGEPFPSLGALATDGLPPEESALAGLLAALGGGTPDVEARFAQVLAEFPHSARGYYLLGLWRAAQGDREAADVAFKHAAELDPDYGPAATSVQRSVSGVQR